MATSVTLVRASTFYTFDADAEITNGETLVIGGKTYTFQTTLTNVDGNVRIGGDREETIANLVAAVGLGPGAGTAYAAATTRNPAVYATPAEDRIDIHALIPGSIGNLIPCTVGTSGVTLDNGTLEGGAGNIGDFFDGLLRLNQINAEVFDALREFTAAID